MRGTAVTDTFTRTVASAWGTTDTGQAWTLDGAGGPLFTSDWSVNGTQGLMSVPVANAYRLAYLGTFNQPYVDLAVDASIAVVPTGGPIEMCNLAVRGTSPTSYYLYRVQVETSASVTVLIFAPGGAQLGSITVPGLTYTANLKLRVRVQAVGKVFRAKVWQAANPEPPNYLLSVVDGTYTGAGWVGIRCGVSTGNTNTLPIVFTYDNLSSVLVPDFPRDNVPLTVLAAFGADPSKDPSTWTWTNITTDVRHQSVVITPGRADETSQAASASCTFQLLNDTKAYSANNPMGPNWPNVKRNTPIWVMIDPATRFFGYANGFVPSWDPSGKMAIVTVSSNGVLRRLMQGKTPVKSPILRATSSRVELRSYWGMEDSPGSATIASGIPGRPPMTFAGLNLAADSTEPGSAPLPVFGAGGTLSASISGSFAGNWQVDWYYKITDPTPNEPKIMTVSTTDNIGASGVTWDVSVGGAFANVMTVRATNSVGTQLVNSAGTVGAPFFGVWIHGRLMCRQNGGNVEWRVAIFPVGAPSGTFLTGTVAGTIGAPYNASVPANAALNGMAIGHLAAFDGYDLYSADQAQTGYRNETVTARLTRLSLEQGVPITITGTSATTMGPQSVDTFVNLLRECEAADMGLLYDGFGPGLGYVTRSARYNLPTSMTLDMAADPPQVNNPFTPADDDQRNRNLWKVDRKNGSSATYEDRTGTLGTAAIGTYDSQVTLNVATDDVLRGYASWLVHMGTVEGFRYPNLSIDLGSNPELIDNWVSAKLNSHIDVLNVSSKATGHTAGTVSLLDEGYTETITPKTYAVAANCSPFGPWQVATVGQDRVDSANSTVRATVAAGATSVQVNVGTVLWTTDGTKLPAGGLPMNMDGIRVLVTAISGVTSPQTFTLDPATVAKSLVAGRPVRLWTPAVVAL